MNDPAVRSKLSAEALSALQAGNVIAAIKIVRRDTGLGLKEAKDLVDAHVASNPELRERIRIESGGGALGWIVVLILVAAALIYFWRR